ncbi:MAG: glucose-1-phosphate thymidylyltransferase [Dehalococcoidia bacterium]
MPDKNIRTTGTMKAIVLCGGKGTRLRPLTYTMAKHLIPLANKPILSYVLEQIREAGITDIGIIVPPDPDGGIKDFYGDGSKLDIKLTYIMQAHAGGLAHAVKTAQDFLGDSNFLMFLGDNLIEGGITAFVNEFINESPDALILLKEVADPTGCGVAELDTTGKVLRVVEKPKIPPSNFILVGAYLFTPEIHKAISVTKPSWRNELEITDAIQNLIEMKKYVRSHTVPGWWLDTGTKNDLLQANRVMLKNLTGQEIKGTVDAQSRLTGPIEIGSGTVIENSVIEGPVSIAGDCRINGAHIGPDACIADGTRVEQCMIQNSIVMDNCQILNAVHLIDSVIGKNVEIGQHGENEKGSSLFVGDNSQIAL